MAHINSCLKRTFIGFNLLFAVIGLLIIGLTMLCQIYTSGEEEEGMGNRTTGLMGLYIMGAVTMLLGLIGAYGAYKEHKVSLIVFLVCMIIGALVMIRGGIPTAMARPQVEGILEEKFREFLPLNTASFQVKHMADTLQTQLHCCGLFSYTDWKGDIPASCMCSPEEEEEEGYECKRVGYPYLMQTREVYSKPCFPIVLGYVLLFADIMLIVFFTLAALAVLGMILSSIMIHQLRHPNRVPVILGIHTIFGSRTAEVRGAAEPSSPY